MSLNSLGTAANVLGVITPAKDAGVKLFVPCEWGDNSDGRPERLFQLKQKVRADSQKAGLPYAAFYNGLWPEFLRSAVFTPSKF